ncbi:rho GTPase-activating protein 17 [Parasteatoda tepidariorum]|uniref:rho GTPase-activating protein 17 n=1 Tax=Parasteatoda tepidariorum TaxID=114398 RepID=UPI001C71B325|nr:rho GTPase-activating protein 17 [Parasteatoda tepidariorum]
MKKQFLRVKQIADQTFLRAEKTDVLTEDLLTAEKRVDSIKLSCQSTHKKIISTQIDFGSETSLEKRLRKIPQVSLGASMLESGNSFSKTSALGDTLKECATVQSKLGAELLEYCNEVEKLILKPIAGVLDNEIHNITKLRKQLGKLVLDMDSARTRFQTAERHSLQASCNTNLNVVGKVDTLKEELEDASQKVEQCRDALAVEMFSLISREPQLAQLLIQFHQLQATYHRNALAVLEMSLPSLQSVILDFPQKPVYGCPLEEHLRVTNRDIAHVLESCISFLVEYGLLEEGLLRIAGSSIKLKKIKSSFDAGQDIDFTEFIRDPHAVSGALKSYLRELPEPLMSASLYDEWLAAIKIQDLDSKLKALWQVLHRLPEANYRNLRYVIQFLSKVHENVDVNKMSSQNLAIIMAPNLIWSPLSSDDGPTLGMNMSIASLHTSIVDVLISYAPWFFPPDESEKTKNINEDEVPFEEVNGNNSSNSVQRDPTASPCLLPKTVKKPAAPPPPLQKSSDENVDISKEKTAALIDLNCEDSSSKIIHSTTTEKPAIPEKPDYSSLSLDRRCLRPSSKGQYNRDARSHIERPTVPPPERPAKPQKFCSSTDSIFHAEEQPDCSLEDVTKDEQNSVSKTNRFDFLMNQKEEDKPPERPPRSTGAPEGTQQGICDPVTQKETCDPVTEKVKPARPQPPVKPKFPLQNENTNL